MQFVSHCHTHSLREKYTEKMQKYANISLYGICHQNGILDTDKEENRAIGRYAYDKMKAWLRKNLHKIRYEHGCTAEFEIVHDRGCHDGTHTHVFCIIGS